MVVKSEFQFFLISNYRVFQIIRIYIRASSVV